MNQDFRKDLWNQFGASIDAIENAITMCPESVWDNQRNFWYNVYHCLFWLDYLLTLEPAKFTPPSPFTLSEFDPNGKKPERTYSKEELLTYLMASRKKCRNLIAGLTDEIANMRWVNEYRNYSVFENLLYNLRHVQHHAAQLNLILRQETNDAPSWAFRAKDHLT